MPEDWARPGLKSIQEAYHYLFSSGLSLSKVKDAALEDRLFPSSDDNTYGVAGRSLSWKIFLTPHEPLQSSSGSKLTPDLASLRASRKRYSDLLLEKSRAPDGSYAEGFVVPGSNIRPTKKNRTSGNLERNNPLSLHNENPWTEYFASVELRKTISQDVERTFPEIGYFRDPQVQLHLTNVLFLYSATNPSIGYRQGMHELLAPLYFAVDFDSIGTDLDALPDNPTMLEFCARSWVAADAWALFEVVMRGVSRWYEWRESPRINDSPLAAHVQLNISDRQNDLKPYVAPIVQDCNRVQSILLKSVDLSLFKSMEAAGIEPQIYGIRWLRLLFTREFSMHDAMVLWDGLFACDPTLELAQWICVVMLIRIRNQLIPSDYSGQLTYLLHYPPPPLVSDRNGPYNHASILLKQALALQMSPTPSAGTSVIMENHNFFGFSIEVPDSSPIPIRRNLRDKAAPNPRSGFIDGLSGHSRQQSSQIGLPEMITRGLLDRGESLGINKTLMNAVTELRRNIPELTSLVRLPMAASTSYPAFPLTDERPPEERPPWEPRSRVDMEREITDLRAMNKTLGKSVGWIVDALLQDESDVKDPRELSTIKTKKREALESLSYVRDVLVGSVDKLDDSLLIGEEELKARRSEEYATKRQEFPRAEVSRPASVPVHESRPRRATPQVISYSRTSVNRSPPPHFLQSTPSSFPSNNSSKPTRLAPWNHTRSDFSSGVNLPAAALPRLPPPTSINFRPPRSLTPPARVMPLPSQNPPPDREAPNDPLGVLP